MRRAKIIVISGIDGAGKTCIIERLREQISSRGYRTRYVWLRYNHYVTKFVLLFGRLMGYTEYKQFEDTRIGYHNFYKSKIVSWVFIASTALDTVFASILKVIIPNLLLNRVVVCDRWVVDILIDLQIDTHIKLGERSLVSKVFWSIVPENANCFMIMRDRDIVKTERKENLYDKNFEARYELYEKYAENPRVTVIHNVDTIDMAVKKILAKLDS